MAANYIFHNIVMHPKRSSVLGPSSHHLQMRENLSPEETRVKVSQASLDASRSPLSIRPLDCTSSGTVTTPGQATQPRGSFHKSKVDWVEAEEGEESGGGTSPSIVANQQRGFILRPSADTAREAQAWYIGHRSNDHSKSLAYSKTLHA